MGKIWGITLKGLETDENGVKSYLWATNEQFKEIMEMLHDETKKDAWFMLGDKPFQIKRIVDFKQMNLDYAKELPSFRKYVLETIEEEKRLGVGEWAEEKQINAEGLKKLDELKSRFRLNKGDDDNEIL